MLSDPLVEHAQAGAQGTGLRAAAEPIRNARNIVDLLDYLATEFATFDDKPFNPVDSAALSQFCMVRAEGIVPPLRETDSSAAPRLRRTFSALRKRQLIQKLSDLVQDRSPSLRGGVRFVDFLRAERYEDLFTGLIPGRV